MNNKWLIGSKQIDPTQPAENQLALVATFCTIDRECQCPSRIKLTPTRIELWHTSNDCFPKKQKSLFVRASSHPRSNRANTQQKNRATITLFHQLLTNVHGQPLAQLVFNCLLLHRSQEGKSLKVPLLVASLRAIHTQETLEPILPQNVLNLIQEYTRPAPLPL